MDLFLEVRDARLPLSTINPAFERFAGQETRAQRLVVYTKRDLADQRFEQPLRQAFERFNNDTVLFADTRRDADMKRVLKVVLQQAHASAARFHHQPTSLNIMMAGMPNVGKSSLLNALRRVGMHKGKAAFTGANAGVTKKVTGVVKIWERPDVYITDTPGISLQYFGRGQPAAERALSLALSGGIKDQFFSLETMAEYLLWRINHRFFAPSADPADIPEQIRRWMPPLPTNDSADFSEAIARSIGALEKGGHADTLRANRWLVEAFRDGKLGSWTLDDLTFSGPSYMALQGDAQRLSIRQEQMQVAGQQLQQEVELQAPPTPAAPQTSLSPVPPRQLVVSTELSFPQRVELSVSSWLSYETHRLLFPRRDELSSHAQKKLKKSEATEKRRVKAQSRGVNLRTQQISRRVKLLIWLRSSKTRKRIQKRRSSRR